VLRGGEGADTSVGNIHVVDSLDELPAGVQTYVPVPYDARRDDRQQHDDGGVLRFPRWVVLGQILGPPG
jgi:hypothetical protein